MAYHYSAPPPGYMPYDYSSASSSPAPEDRYDFPRARTFPVPASGARNGKGHARAASYSTPQRSHAEWHATPGGYPPPPYYPTTPSYHYSPGAQYEYADAHDYAHTPTKRHHTEPVPLKRRSSRSHKARVYAVPDDAPDRVLDSSADEPLYTYIAPRNAPAPAAGGGRHRSMSMRKTSTFHHTRSPAYDAEEVDTPTRSRAHVRRPSTATPTKSKGKAPNYTPTASPATKAKAAAQAEARPPTPRVATSADASRHRIPAGYSLKNWDPEERPFLLLGSVFDGNSLGKWIYDWTYFQHGARAPINDVAGELWLLLIKFAGKLKRADEGLARVRRSADRELVEDYVVRGRKLWGRVQELLKHCETYMWKAARREGARDGKVVMGEKSGVEFVLTIFGRDRELPRTEKLMSGIRLFNLRFDHDCEDLLGRRPRGK